jgi:hypothetical protein
MERRYLVAVVVISATFAVTSHGFRALQKLSLAHARHSGVMAHSKCDPSAALRALARIRTRLRPRYPEEAQLLAEMNLPFANMETTMTEQMADQMAQQSAAISQCTREQAMRDAEHAIRLQQQRMTRFAGSAGMPPASISVLPPDFEQQVQKATAMATRMAANKVAIRIAHGSLDESLQQLDKMELPTITVADDGVQVSTHFHATTHCNVKRKPSAQQPQ